jgi:uncharacterized protein YbjQ (UPF0145 family)
MDPQNDALGLLAGLAIFVLGLLAFLSPLLILLVGGLVGAAREKRHFDDLARRESALAGFLITDLKTLPTGLDFAASTLVSGSVVIASDHFKTFCAQWRKLFGGEFHSLARMQERARREAVLRMIEEARRLGATSVCNVRIEASSIGARQDGKVSGCELMAYGTALIPVRD